VTLSGDIEQKLCFNYAVVTKFKYWADCSKRHKWH